MRQNWKSMNTLRVKRHITAEYLRSSKDMALYLEACAAEAPEDAEFLSKALADVLLAIGANSLMGLAGVPHEAVFRALSGDLDALRNVSASIRAVVGVENEQAG